MTEGEHIKRKDKLTWNISDMGKKQLGGLDNKTNEKNSYKIHIDEIVSTVCK